MHGGWRSNESVWGRWSASNGEHCNWYTGWAAVPRSVGGIEFEPLLHSLSIQLFPLVSCFTPSSKTFNRTLGVRRIQIHRAAGNHTGVSGYSSYFHSPKELHPFMPLRMAGLKNEKKKKYLCVFFTHNNSKTHTLASSWCRACMLVCHTVVSSFTLQCCGLFPDHAWPSPAYQEDIQCVQRCWGKETVKKHWQHEITWTETYSGLWKFLPKELFL